MKKIFTTAVALLLLAACANGSGPEPTNPVERADEIWLQNRELYYRNAGWTRADATFQAEQDFAAGKSIPADRPPLERRPRG